jgi:hypothetical protein
MICARAHLFCYYLRSNPLGLKLAGVLGVGASQKPMSNIHNLTFGSLHALIYLWYFCKFATALSLSDSSWSFSSALLGHMGAPAVVHKLRCFTSSGRTTSAPYISLNGIKFVALHTIVLCLHTACGITSACCPFFSPSSIFLIASNIRVFALSTAPLVWG